MIGLSKAARAKKAARGDQAKVDDLRLADRVTDMLQRNRPPSSREDMRVETRKVERIVPMQREVRVNLVNGKSFPARVINISTEAIGLDADFSAVKDSDLVSVNGKHVEMGRRLRPGAALMFKKPLQGPIGPDVVLRTLVTDMFNDRER